MPKKAGLAAQQANNIGMDWNPKTRRAEVQISAEEAAQRGLKYDVQRGVGYVSRRQLDKRATGKSHEQRVKERRSQGIPAGYGRRAKHGKGYWNEYKVRTFKSLPAAYGFIRRNIPPDYRVHISIHGRIFGVPGGTGTPDAPDSEYGYRTLQVFNSDSFAGVRADSPRYAHYTNEWERLIVAPLYDKTHGDYDRIIVRYRPAKVQRAPDRRQF